MELPLLKKRSQSLNRAIVQSLHILQLPMHEMEGYLREQAEENPILVVQSPEKPVCIEQTYQDLTLSWGDPSYRAYDSTWHQEEICGWSGGDAPPLHQIYKSNPKSFTQQLISQLRQDSKIPPEFLPHCIFFAESLDSRGYFVEDMQQMADLLEISLTTAEEVLFMVQEMQPVGVAARNLQECLLLQLAKTPNFNRKTLALISQDPACFQPVDFKWMAELLGSTVSEAQKSWQAVRGFHPVPTAVSAERPSYLIPEATVVVEDGKLSVEFHRESAPTATLNPELLEALDQQKDSILSSYQQLNKNSATYILEGLEKRRTILDSIISFMVAYQQDYFLNPDQPLKPLGMTEISKFLELHPSWVSRALCDKYLLTPQGLVPLKALLSQQWVPETLGEQDRDRIHTRLRMLIAGEDKSAPLSDSKIQALLEGFHIEIARRTVAKYRGLLDIPNASQRKEVPKTE